MKKIVLLAITIAACLNIALAQSQFPLYVQPKLGISSMPFSYTSTYEGDHRMGFHGGLGTGYQVNDWFSIKLDVLFSQKKKGYSFKETSSLSKTLSQGLFGNLFGSGGINLSNFFNDTVYAYTKGTVHLSYLELPPMLSGTYKGFSISAGAYAAFLVKAKTKTEFKQEVPALSLFEPLFDSIPFGTTLLNGMFPARNSPVITESSDKSAYKRFDYGLVIDLSYQASNNLLFAFRYTQGFDNYRTAPLKHNDHHKVWMVTIGYTIGGKTNGNGKSPKAIYDLEKKPVDK